MAATPDNNSHFPYYSLFRHATDPSDATRLAYPRAGNGSAGRARASYALEMNEDAKPRSRTNSFDSDLLNYFRQSRRYSMPPDAGETASRGAAGASMFDFAISRYGGTLLPISPPPKEKERLRSLTKLFSGSWQKKPSISAATNPQHIQHVEFDLQTGRFVGLPKQWEQSLSSGESADRWQALMTMASSPSQSHLSLPVDPSSYPSGMINDSKRLTSSSATDSFYSDNSRYRVPAERPPSFPSTTASINEEFYAEIDALRQLPATPRPLPYTPL